MESAPDGKSLKPSAGLPNSQPPELQQMFSVAFSDRQTAEMLDFPVRSGDSARESSSPARCREYQQSLQSGGLVKRLRPLFRFQTWTRGKTRPGLTTVCPQTRIGRQMLSGHCAGLLRLEKWGGGWVGGQRPWSAGRRDLGSFGPCPRRSNDFLRYCSGPRPHGEYSAYDSSQELGDRGTPPRAGSPPSAPRLPRQETGAPSIGDGSGQCEYYLAAPKDGYRHNFQKRLVACIMWMHPGNPPRSSSARAASVARE